MAKTEIERIGGSVGRMDGECVCLQCEAVVGSAKEGIMARAKLLVTAVPVDVSGLGGESSDYVDEKIVFRRLLCPSCGCCLHASAGIDGEPLPQFLLL